VIFFLVDLECFLTNKIQYLIKIFTLGVIDLSIELILFV